MADEPDEERRPASDDSDGSAGDGEPPSTDGADADGTGGSEGVDDPVTDGSRDGAPSDGSPDGEEPSTDGTGDDGPATDGTGDADADGTAGDTDGAADDEGPRFDADDLVAGGEYVGNRDDGDGRDAALDESPGSDGEGESADGDDGRDGETADRDDEHDGEGVEREGEAGDETGGEDDESGKGDEAVEDDGYDGPGEYGPIRPDPDGPVAQEDVVDGPPGDEPREADDVKYTREAAEAAGLDPEEVDLVEPDDDGNLSPGSRPGPEEEYERPDNMAEATPIERKQGPAEDQEMPLADHVEEMVARLFIIVAVAGVVSVAVFPFGEELIDFLWYSVLPGGDVAQPRVYHPLALVITQLKVASLGGLIVALPVFVYQTYAFMRPGLYPHERRYYLAAVPTSLVLAFVGVTFSYFIVLPAIFTYFLYYSREVTTIAFALSQTFNLILLLMGYLAVVFQIPLFIMLAIMMGLVTRRWLEARRLYFWAGFLGISFIFNPDPTGMAPFIVTVTMIGLFEGTLLLLRWTGR